MLIEFVKITAQGNDYIYIDNRRGDYSVSESMRQQMSKDWSDRHFGIGSDGVVWLESSQETDCRMRMYNADGSLGKMCGSALRSVVYLLSKEENKKQYAIKTDSGMRLGWANGNTITVNMGKAVLLKKIHASEFRVQTGNNHVVRIVEDLAQIDFDREIRQKRIELHSGDNYQYVKIVDSQTLTLKIFEHGSGPTLACGTGAVAAAYICREEKLVTANQVKVIMPGGNVLIEIKKQEIYLTGAVQEVYWGKKELPVFGQE